MSKVEAGNNVSVHYVGTFTDGEKFDSSRDRGETLSFEVGSGQMIAGFDAAVVGMSVGETKTVTIEPKDAYGERNENAIQEVPRSNFPEGFNLIEGATVSGRDQDNRPMIAKIISFNDENVNLDFNHPLAGKQLNFEVELVSID
tara:strand:+ start:493 stop:924 length:432 start_codon:yes stop_codon:yes gene_type:complete